jgi:hypothetical protein
MAGKSAAPRKRAKEHREPTAAPAGITVNLATNDLTLNPGDTLEETDKF